MAVDIGGNTIAASGSGLAINSNLVFDSNGVGSVADIPGYTGWKGGSDGWYASSGSGWQVNNTRWSSGLNTSNGVFTCPIAGLYACGFDGILNGGSNVNGNTYGYFAFLKNNVLVYWGHCNVQNAWNQGGIAQVLNCAAGDTIVFKINQSPLSTSEAYYANKNYGAYPEAHHAVWIALIG